MIQKAFVAVCILLSMAGSGAQVTLAYTANRQGETEPCGCKIKDLGGIVRMEKRLRQLRHEGGVLFLDAGNAFFSAPKLHESRLKTEELRADRIAQSYRRMGLKVFSPGDRDFALGSAFFWGLIRKAGATAVSSNLESTSEGGKFTPFTVWEEQGVRIAVLGLTAFDPALVPQGLKQRAPKEALREVWKSLQKEKLDQVVLLSHLGPQQDEELAKEFPGIWIIGSKSLDFFNEPKKVGNSYLFEVGIEGQRLGEITIEKGKPGWARAKLSELDEAYDKLGKTK